VQADSLSPLLRTEEEAAAPKPSPQTLGALLMASPTGAGNRSPGAVSLLLGAGSSVTAEREGPERLDAGLSLERRVQGPQSIVLKGFTSCW
jgi:hypothetical protein